MEGRVGLQVAAAAALAAFGPRVTLFWPFSHPIASGLVTVLWVVVLVNAFAFLENAVLLAQTACLIGVAALVETSAIRRKGGP